MLPLWLAFCRIRNSCIIRSFSFSTHIGFSSFIVWPQTLRNVLPIFHGPNLNQHTDRFGDEDTQYRSYEQVLYPEYNIDNDICLLRLTEPLNMTNPKSVKAIALNRRDDFESGEPFTVTGWGTLQVCVHLGVWIIVCILHRISKYYCYL